MLGAIQLPQWLADFWAVYGDMITPVLVTLLVSLVTWLALQIKSTAKINAAKADLQIEALKTVANREDNKPQLEEQSQKIQELEKVILNLSEMINVAFQNSNLDPEIKANLTALNNKIKYGSEEELIKELEQNNEVLKQQLEELTHKLSNNVIETVKTETTKRARR